MIFLGGWDDLETKRRVVVAVCGEQRLLSHQIELLRFVLLKELRLNLRLWSSELLPLVVSSFKKKKKIKTDLVHSSSPSSGGFFWTLFVD